MSPSLAECLATQDANSIYASQIQTGSVYKMRFEESDGIISKKQGDNGRNKLFVVLNSDDQYAYGCLLINTNVNTKALSKEAQQIQYPVKGEKYNGAFTVPISYVDCSKIWPIPLARIRNATFKCVLDQADLNYINSSVTSGNLIPPAVLKRFNLI